jgi:hypothetical protein
MDLNCVRQNLRCQDDVEQLHAASNEHRGILNRRRRVRRVHLTQCLANVRIVQVLEPQIHVLRHHGRAL